jgi:hypothetical protein
MKALLYVALSATVVGGGVGAARGCTTEVEPVAYIRDVWVDSLGREVASAGALWHVDGEGRVYYLDPETAQPLDVYNNLAMHAGYERPDCEGPLLVAHRVPPRVPFSLGDGKGYRVRPDDSQGAPAVFRSRELPSGECQEILIPQERDFAFLATPPVMPGLPTLSYLGPLHVERRP